MESLNFIDFKTKGLYFRFALILNAVFFGISTFFIVTKCAIPAIRLNLYTVTLLSAILSSYWVFYLESKGDLFAFINILIFWYFIMFFIPLLLITHYPETRTKVGYWSFESFELAVFLVIVSFYSLLIGYLFANRVGREWHLHLGEHPSVKRIILVIIISIILYIISLILRSYFMGTSILKVLSFHSYATNFTKREYSMGVYTFTNLLGSGMGYLLLFYLILPKNTGTKKLLIWFTPIVFLFLIYGLIGAFLNTSKALFFNLIFLITGYYNYVARKIKPKQIIAVFFCCVLILSYFNYRRMSGDMRGESNIFSITKIMYAQTFDDMETFAVVCDFFPKKHAYYNGRRTAEEILLLPIPRALWKDKPLAYGFRDILNDINPGWFSYGYHPGLQSQFYADFGIIGIIVGFFIFGAIIRLIYNSFCKYKCNKGAVIFYITIISNSWLYLKGGFPWLNLLVISYLPLYLLLMYIYPKINTRRH
ncbi:MAG: hypothetical protein ABSB18_01235 [Candidatus Omnitrophota bacterium]